MKSERIRTRLGRARLAIRPKGLVALAGLAILAISLVMAGGLGTVGAEQAGESGRVQLGPPIISPTEVVFRIAIPAFTATGAAAREPFHEIIYRDLELSGYFTRTPDQSAVEAGAQVWRQAGKQDFSPLKALGAHFVVEGGYETRGGELAASVYLLEIGSGRRVFGKAFKNAATQQRVLAHRISDEILLAITGIEGVANTKILYVSTSSPMNKTKSVYVMDADGAGARRLSPDNALVLTPCWGANATEFYYTTYRDYNPDLSGLYLHGGSPWFISRFPGLNTSPSWNQKRGRMVLTLGKDGNSEIYTMGRDGKNLKRLTYNRAIDASPCWSPGGSEVVFTSDRAGSPQIYIMDGEGLNDRRISFVNSTWCDSASWSPKGDKIAFAARVEGQFQIFVCDVDGSNPKRLTGSGNNEDPSWAPNGELIAFRSDRTGSDQIYVMSADGSNQTQLTRGGYNTAPSWSPYLFEKKG